MGSSSTSGVDVTAPAPTPTVRKALAMEIRRMSLIFYDLLERAKRKASAFTLTTMPESN